MRFWCILALCCPLLWTMCQRWVVAGCPSPKCATVLVNVLLTWVVTACYIWTVVYCYFVVCSLMWIISRLASAVINVYKFVCFIHECIKITTVSTASTCQVHVIFLPVSENGEMYSVMKELMGQCPPPQNFWARTAPASNILTTCDLTWFTLDFYLDVIMWWM